MNYSVEERKKIFNALFNFARKLEFKFSYVLIPKQKYTDIIALTSAISKQLSDVIKEKMGHWNTFNKKIVYYDNGQVELTKIITSVFHALFEDVEFRKVQPVDYKLFQVADLICTLMLLKEKQSFTNSETQFFKNYRDFKKNYLKHIERKIL